MTTVAESILRKEVTALKAVATALEWYLQELTPDQFLLNLKARDGDIYFVRLETEGYRGLPAIWRWVSENGVDDQPNHAPKGSGFLHGGGVICAPWNRLAYKSVDGRGPHEDWELASWMTNSHTGACLTLAAMALRIHVELTAETYQGRLVKKAA